MGKVGTGFSMSLDGFIAEPNDDVTRLFAWMGSGEHEVKLSTGDHDIDLKVSSESAEMFADASRSVGALIAGRRLFDVANAWAGKHPLNVPIVVVTHHVPQEWVTPESIFTFVTDGVESAVKTAQEIAGEKSIAIASTTIVQQCLKLGLLDEIHIDLVPILLNSGIRLFDHLDIEPVDLEITSVIRAPDVVHLDFRVIK